MEEFKSLCESAGLIAAQNVDPDRFEKILSIICSRYEAKNSTENATPLPEKWDKLPASSHGIVPLKSKPRHIVDLVMSLCKCSKFTKDILVAKLDREILTGRLSCLSVRSLIEEGLFKLEFLQNNASAYTIDRGVNMFVGREGEPEPSQDDLFMRRGSKYVSKEAFIEWASEVGFLEDVNIEAWDAK